MAWLPCKPPPKGKRHRKQPLYQKGGFFQRLNRKESSPRPSGPSVSMPSLPPPTCGECLGSAPASYESEEQEALAPVRGVRGWGASPGWRNHSFGKASLRKKPLGDVATVCPASFSTRCPAFAFSSSPSASSAYRIS